MTKRIVYGLVIIGFLLLVTTLFVNSNKQIVTINSIIQHQTITTGTVHSASLRANSGASLDVVYSFIAKHKQYDSEVLITGIQKRNFETSFTSKQFPVIYDSTNPSNNRIVITPKDFKRFQMQFPDTLKWVNNFWDSHQINFP